VSTATTLLATVGIMATLAFLFLMVRDSSETPVFWILGSIVVISMSGVRHSLAMYLVVLTGVLIVALVRLVHCV